MIAIHGELVADWIYGDTVVPVAAFEGIHASAGGEPVLDMESAVLQIPTPGSAGFLALEPPDTKEAFLHQIVP